MANYKKGFNLRHGVQVDDDNFIVNANGLVGIGTSVPTENLHIIGNTRVTGLSTTQLLYAGIGTIENLKSSGAVVSGAVTATTFYGSAAGLTGIYAIAVDGWYVGSGVIGTTSKVGAGKINPTSALDVSGDALVSGIGTFGGLNVNGNANVTGVVTAITFNGNATNATRSGLATDLEINATNRLLYQVSNNNTDVLPAGTSGQVLQSNGGSAPSWVNQGSLSAASAVYASTAGVATYAQTAGVATSVLNGTGYLTQLQVTGISTFGSGTISGAPSDIVLALAGINSSAYVGGKVGIKTLSPLYELDVVGTVNATAFIGDGSQLSNVPPGALTSCCTNNITAPYLTSHPDIQVAENNFFAGVGVGCSITVGCNNNFFGYNAGRKTTSGRSNNFFGPYAGCGNISGGYNNFIGHCAGSSNNAGSLNNFFGYSTGYYNIDGCYNNFFGSYAGLCNEYGSSNNFFGRNAGYGNTTGNYNNFFGSNAGYYNSNGCHNNFLGACSGYSNSVGNHNNFLSCNAGYYNNSGNCNNFFGFYSGYYNTSGSRNNSFGGRAGFCNITGNNNNFIGVRAGYANTSGNNNIFLGSYSGISTSASGKIIFGYGLDQSNRFDSPDTKKDTQFAVGVRNRQEFVDEISNQTGTIAGLANTITGITTTSIYIGQQVRCDTLGVLPENTFVIGILSGQVELNNSSLSVVGVTTTFDFGINTYPTDYWLVGDENFNVGIGTTNPQTKLQVGGTVLADGFISVGNTTPIKITLVGNTLTFTAVGIGSTSLTLA